jgi:hypothetical protein
MASSLVTGRTDAAVTGNKTLAAADSGIVQNVTASATITLPAASGLTGMAVVVRNGGAGSTDGAVTINVTPNGTDQVVGNGFTAANGKGAVNTTGAGGNDFLRIVCDGTSKWYVQDSSGTWSRQP